MIRNSTSSYVRKCGLKTTTEEDVKKGQLATTLWVHALNWYIRFIQVP